MSKNQAEFLTRGPVVLLLALFCCLLWGSATPCIKLGYKMFAIEGSDSASVLLFAGARFTIAGLMAIAMGSAARKKLLIPRRSSIRPILILSFFQTIWQYFFFYLGLTRSTGVKTAIIVGTNVFISILVASLLFHMEALTGRKILGCLLGFAGVLVINLSGRGLTGGFTFRGEGFIFLGILGYAFSSVLLKRFGRSEEPVLLSGWQFFVGGLVLAAIGLAMGGHLTVPSASAFAMLLYLGFISGAAYSVWALLLKYNPVSRITVTSFMNSVFGVLLSALLLGETEQAFRPASLVALALVCCGIWVVNRPVKQA